MSEENLVMLKWLFERLSLPENEREKRGLEGSNDSFVDYDYDQNRLITRSDMMPCERNEHFDDLDV